MFAIRARSIIPSGVRPFSFERENDPLSNGIRNPYPRLRANAGRINNSLGRLGHPDRGWNAIAIAIIWGRAGGPRAGRRPPTPGRPPPGAAAGLLLRFGAQAAARPREKVEECPALLVESKSLSYLVSHPRATRLTNDPHSLILVGKRPACVVVSRCDATRQLSPLLLSRVNL